MLMKSLPIHIFYWIFLLPVLLTAQPPEGYYNSATGLSGEDLKAALHEIIKGHTTIEYFNVTDALKVLDEDPDNSSNVILIYKRTSIAKTAFGTGSDDWNREHLWPVSHGNFGTNPQPVAICIISDPPMCQ
jgi:endonuclease I